MSARIAVAVALAAALLGACGDDDDEDGAATTTTATVEASTTTSTTAEEPSTTTTEAELEVGDPLDAAEAFLQLHFPGTTATLSEFRQGDTQSGEVEVRRPAEGGGTANVASTLLLRLAGDQWRVIGAVSPNVTIDAPENGATVPAGALTVSGVGRGFEALIVARAFDDVGTMVAEAISSGGALADPEPYTAELDLSGVAAGTELVVVSAGGTGLEGDPGEFSAVRVTIG